MTPACHREGQQAGSTAFREVLIGVAAACANNKDFLRLKEESEKPGVLYLVASPIGNLEDLSLRSKKILSDCDLIACEDTRVTAKLLAHLGINQSLISYREENEKKQTPLLAEKLLQGKQLALLSDAGYPGISDPGFRLIRECHLRSIRVIPIPGPNAAITALAASGLPTHQFLYLGFFPKKDNGVIKILEQWKDFPGSIIFYESRYKVARTLRLIRETLGTNRYVCMAREITKLYETIHSGTIEEVENKYHSESPKGEFTLVVAPQDYSFSK
ncbi:MAG: 16S rRNA (cytidine(1402)-2'-O)-methyltransferase [Opitutae bacterium]|nr:16S rRNA (cytidine(1402)-2'-O)-methyltransferase [Opitutae bacterium]|tara:strand:+ start:6468 stop:7286 length:819 start_codon:yes stop_codon:yes gene_type:complete